MPGRFNRLVFAGELLLGEQVLAPPDRPGSPYEEIKSAEALFPVPTPVAVVDVGTYDGMTGRFDGHVSSVQVLPPVPGQPGGNKPNVITLPPIVDVDAVEAVLRFRIINRQGAPFAVTAAGRTVTAPPLADTIEVPVGREQLVDWTLIHGGESLTEKLSLRRPPIIGAGAFRLPAFPVAVIYEPPADQQRRNRTSYAVAESVGTKVSVSVTDETQTTRPVTAPFFHLDGLREQIELFTKVLTTTATIAGGTVDPKLKTGLDLVARAIGKSSASATYGTKVTTGGEFSTTDTVEDGINTGPNDGGPGVGDVIVYLRDVELVWLAGGGAVSLGVLGYGRLALQSVQFLKDQLAEPTIGLDAATLNALLALDPFATGGPAARLDPARFTFVEAFELSGVSVTRTISHQVTVVDRRSTATFTTQAQDMKKGFLSFLGLGVPETVSIKTTATHSSGVDATSSIKASIGLELHAEAGEHYGVEVHYDRVFGTFAIRPLALGAGPALSGQLTGSDGRPLAGQTVTLTAADGRRYSVLTDARGHYAFHAQGLADGEAALAVGPVTKPVRLQAGRPARLDRVELPFRRPSRLP